MLNLHAEAVADLEGADTVVCCLECGQIAPGFMAGDMAYAEKHPSSLPGHHLDRIRCKGSGCMAELVPSGALKVSVNPQIGLDCSDFPVECRFCALNVGGGFGSQPRQPPCLRLCLC